MSCNLEVASWINRFLLQVAFSHSVYYSNRMQTRTLGLKACHCVDLFPVTYRVVPWDDSWEMFKSDGKGDKAGQTKNLKMSLQLLGNQENDKACQEDPDGKSNNSPRNILFSKKLWGICMLHDAQDMHCHSDELSLWSLEKYHMVKLVFPYVTVCWGWRGEFLSSGYTAFRLTLWLIGYTWQFRLFKLLYQKILD